MVNDVPPIPPESDDTGVLDFCEVTILLVVVLELSSDVVVDVVDEVVDPVVVDELSDVGVEIDDELDVDVELVDEEEAVVELVDVVGGMYDNSLYLKPCSKYFEAGPSIISVTRLKSKN